MEVRSGECEAFTYFFLFKNVNRDYIRQFIIN